MTSFRADLHIHSCLSPCGDLTASPSAIAKTACSKGLDLIALTDHNTARNAPAFAEACRREGIAALFGSEVTTKEEVHALVLFADPFEALAAGEELYERLDSEPFDPESFGDQVYVDADDNVEGFLDRLLIIGATDLGLDDLALWARGRNGLVIPAHIDRPGFGALGQLGFLPEGPFDAVETTKALVSRITDPWPVIASSDAHRPQDIGRRFLEFDAEKADFEGLSEALKNRRCRPVFQD